VPTSSKGYVAFTPGGPISPLNVGDPIGPGQTYFTGASGTLLPVSNPPTLLGFRFRNENVLSDPNDDTVHFGWLRANVPFGLPGTLIDYAWETAPNTAIAAGVVPEPAAALSMLVLTALAVRSLRVHAT
jgi:hypothetical protein